MIYIARHSFFYFKFMRERRKILRESKNWVTISVVGFWQSRYFRIMLLEIVVCSIHMPPGVKDTILRVDQMGKPLRYDISTYITVVMLCRCYLLFRVYSRFSIYRGSFADKCCARVGTEAGTSFGLKCIYKENPFSLLFFTFFTSAIAFGLAVRLFEL